MNNIKYIGSLVNEKPGFGKDAYSIICDYSCGEEYKLYIFCRANDRDVELCGRKNAVACSREFLKSFAAGSCSAEEALKDCVSKWNALAANSGQKGRLSELIPQSFSAIVIRGREMLLAAYGKCIPLVCPDGRQIVRLFTDKDYGDTGVVNGFGGQDGIKFRIFRSLPRAVLVLSNNTAFAKIGPFAEQAINSAMGKEAAQKRMLMQSEINDDVDRIAGKYGIGNVFGCYISDPRQAESTAADADGSAANGRLSAEPVKPEPIKPEPVKPEPIKPEPVKPAPPVNTRPQLSRQNAARIKGLLDKKAELEKRLKKAEEERERLLLQTRTVEEGYQKSIRLIAEQREQLDRKAARNKEESDA